MQFLNKFIQSMEWQNQPKKIRISIDAKARMNIGNFSRGGRNRVLTKAEDHDLDVKEKLTPFGFYLPEHDDFFLFFTAGYMPAVISSLTDWKKFGQKFKKNME